MTDRSSELEDDDPPCGLRLVWAIDRGRVVDLRPGSGDVAPDELSAFVDQWGLAVTGDSYARTSSREFNCEHWLTVEPEHLEDLAARLRAWLGLPTIPYKAQWRRHRLLLDALRQAFAGGTFTSHTDLRDWLDAEDIPNEYDTYASIDLDW